MKKWVAIATAIGSLTACSSSSTAPTPTAPPANIAGDYNVNLIASSTCAATLPPDTSTLFFVATISQSAAAVQLQLVAKAAGNPSVTVPGTISGQTVNFPNLSISQPMGHGVTFTGSGNASVGANGSITGTLSGTYQTPSGSSCNAANHQLELVKLCLQPTPTGSALVPCQQ